MNTKEYRKELADLFVKVLEEKGLDWKKEWSGHSQAPQNAKRGTGYKGINRLRLMLVAMERRYEDPRWATYNQIQDMGCRLKHAKGQGVRVEYWFPYDLKEKHAVSWEQFQGCTQEEKAKRYTLRASYSTVFNGELIEGLKELPEPETRDISMDGIVETLSKNMQVEILNDGGDRAFYRPSEDKIHLPLPEFFYSDYAYNSTALHELAHATGAASRLNRKTGGFFGSESYAYEELIAEISSCFMSANLALEQDGHHVENHRAYVQNWIMAIREKPETLAKAVAEAEKTTAYMECKAELISKKEYEKAAGSVMEADNPKQRQQKAAQKKVPATTGPKL